MTTRDSYTSITKTDSSCHPTVPVPVRHGPIPNSPDRPGATILRRPYHDPGLAADGPDTHPDGRLHTDLDGPPRLSV